MQIEISVNEKLFLNYRKDYSNYCIFHQTCRVFVTLLKDLKTKKPPPFKMGQHELRVKNAAVYKHYHPILAQSWCNNRIVLRVSVSTNSVLQFRLCEREEMIS